MKRLTQKTESGSYTLVTTSLDSVIDKLGRLEDLEDRLKETYGECDGLLETVVEYLTKHAGFLPDKTTKSRLLTDEHVDRLEKYEAIGTVRECREAVEKQKAKKPVTYRHTNRADCSVCGGTVGMLNPFGNWCSKCGQAIDWSED